MGASWWWQPTQTSHVERVICLSPFLPSGFPDSLVGKESACKKKKIIICLQCRRPWFDSWAKKICWKRDRLPTPVFLGFPCGSASKKSAYSVGDLSSIPGLGRSSGEGKDYPLQYSGLENFSPLGYKELDRTEQFLLSLFLPSITKWLFFPSFFKFHLENNFAHL